MVKLTGTALVVAEIAAGAAFLVWVGWYGYPERHDVDDGWRASERYEFSADEVRQLIRSARLVQPSVEPRKPASVSAGHCTHSKRSSRDPGKLVDASPTLHSAVPHALG